MKTKPDPDIEIEEIVESIRDYEAKLPFCLDELREPDPVVYEIVESYLDG